MSVDLQQLAPVLENLTPEAIEAIAPGLSAYLTGTHDPRSRLADLLRQQRQFRQSGQLRQADELQPEIDVLQAIIRQNDAEGTEEGGSSRSEWWVVAGVGVVIVLALLALFAVVGR